MKTLKPFMFVKTVVVWAEDSEDAYNKLPDVLSESDDPLYDWSYDELQSGDQEWIEAMGGEIEIDE